MMQLHKLGSFQCALSNSWQKLQLQDAMPFTELEAKTLHLINTTTTWPRC